ncbi:MAG: hypothetical protein WA865_03055 [Spirulinaceae cyanobacterium]
MKLNSTVALTLILLATMLGAGTVSALWGYTLGYGALKGVTQPDVSPTKKLAEDKTSSSGSEGVKMLSEQTVLAQVSEKIDSTSTVSELEEKKEDDTKNLEEQKEAEEKAKEKESAVAGNFPIISQDQGVTLEVVGASQQGGSLLLDVNMKNQGSQEVRFLYSFLDVKDEQGRALSAITEGLPGELPSNGREFSGKVRIPTALLEDAKNISLTLTDYPDQKLQLSLANIPVVR